MSDELERISYIVEVRVMPVRDGVWNQPEPDLERAAMSYRAGRELILRQHIEPSRGGIQYATWKPEKMKHEIIKALCEQEVER